jgi:hypothetical protein
MAEFLSLVDVCRLTAVCQTLRFAWPVKYNACLAVLKKAMAYFGWPCLPPLSDQVKRVGSCEYNVFCSMMESKCRIANIDFDKQVMLFCVSEGCGEISTLRHNFGGQAFTTFTRCKKCCQIQGRFDEHVVSAIAHEKHWVEMYKLFGEQFAHRTTSGMVMKSFYKNLKPNSIDSCLNDRCCTVVSTAFIKQQVAMHAEEFSKKLLEKYKRKKI